jgi:hypothetical protein
MSAAKAEKIVLYASAQGLQAHCGWQKLRVTAPAETPEGYAQWKRAVKAIQFPAWAVQAMPVLTQYLPHSPGLEHLDAVHASEAGLIATDSLVLAACVSAGMPQTLFVPPLIAQASAQSWGADKHGVACLGASGYIYQTVADAIGTYPTTKLRTMVEDALKAKTIAKLRVRQLYEAVQQLAKFSFAVIQPKLQLRYTAGPYGALSICDAQIDIKRVVPVKASAGCEATWPADRLTPWLGLVDGRDAHAVVELAQLQYCIVLRCLVDAQRYVLMVVQ